MEAIIGNESDSFLDFIGQILVWDPQERIRPLEALAHPWILEGLPDEVLRLHYQMLGIDVTEEDQDNLRHFQNESSAYQSENEKPSNLLDGLDDESGGDYTDMVAQF